jgi:hypothetical protein
MTHMQLSFCFSNSSGVNLVCVICGFWWVKNSVQYRRNRSLTRGEIDAYWRLKKRIEEDHLKAISGLSSSTQVYYFLWAGFFPPFCMDTLYLYLKRYRDHAMYVTGWRGRGSWNRVSEIKLLTCSHYQGGVHGHGDWSSKFGATYQEKWLVIN